MAIKTEDILPELPGTEPVENVDWVGILDRFDPYALEKPYLEECARRRQGDTCYGWNKYIIPVEVRLERLKKIAEEDRNALIDRAAYVAQQGLKKNSYKGVRSVLVRAVGSKGALAYVQMENDRMSEEQKRIQREEYEEHENRLKNKKSNHLGKNGTFAHLESYMHSIEKMDEYMANIMNGQEWKNPMGGLLDFMYPRACISHKVVRIREGIKDANGNPFGQKDFARLLDYPFEKYVEAENMDAPHGDGELTVEKELLEKLIFIVHANPFYLLDPFCAADYGVYEAIKTRIPDVVDDHPTIYASLDVILQWVKDGKPMETRYEDEPVIFPPH